MPSVICPNHTISVTPIPLGELDRLHINIRRTTCPPNQQLVAISTIPRRMRIDIVWQRIRVLVLRTRRVASQIEQMGWCGPGAGGLAGGAPGHGDAAVRLLDEGDVGFVVL